MARAESWARPVAGVDSIEHGTFIDQAGANAMKARGTYYSATLMAFSGVQGLIGTGKLAPESEAKARTTFEVWGKGLNLAYRTASRSRLGPIARSLRTALPIANSA
jgi:imidazolonepropionase-like amidohydrolase